MVLIVALGAIIRGQCCGNLWLQRALLLELSIVDCKSVLLLGKSIDGFVGRNHSSFPLDAGRTKDETIAHRIGGHLEGRRLVSW
jgi:hypothetical protein